MSSPSAASPASPRRLWLLGLGLVLTLGLGLVVASWWSLEGDGGGQPGDGGGARAEPASSSSASVASVASVSSSLSDGRSRSGPASTATPRAGEQVTGQLVDPDSGPIDSGRVEFWCEDGRPIGRARVDSEGWFSGPACVERTCVRLIHPSFEQPLPWSLEQGRAHELELAPASRVSGVVSGPEGDGVADAALSVEYGGRRATGRTDVDGAFAVALPGLRPCDPCDRERGPPRCAEDEARASERARVFVIASAFAPRELEVALDSVEPVTIELADAAAPITGRIVGARGAAFDARTKILATNVERGDERHHAQVDDRGRFEIVGLAEARYRLRAIRDGRELASVDDIAPGQVIELQADVEARGVTLRLEIVDEDGAAAPGVRVDGGPFVGQRSGRGGELEAPQVLAGDYTLRLRAGGCVTEAPVKVGAQAVAEARIQASSTCEAD